MKNALTTIASPATAITMTSLEMVAYINAERLETGEVELRHDHFMAKVPDVLGKAAPKFSGTAFYSVNNATRSRPIYSFPKREACLMAMSYSYALQAKVFDRMTELEAQAPATTRVPTNFREALLLAAAQQEELEEAQAQLTLAAPKVAVFDTVIGDKNMTLLDYIRTLNGVKQTYIGRDLKPVQSRHLFVQ